jgi:hypothetical protein
MHGRKKLTAEQREQKAARELSKISEYCALVDAFEQLPGSTNQPASSPLPMTITQEWDSHVRPLLDQLLNWNPEYYSVWNYRRRVLQSLNKYNVLPFTIKLILYYLETG